jgi:plastocyanin
MKGRIPNGVAALTLAAAAVVIVVGGGGLVRADPSAEAATTVTVNFGSDWFCDSSFENPDPNAFCTTVVSVGDTVTWQWTEGRHDVVECGPNWSKWNNQNEVCVGADFDSGTLSSSNQTWSRTFDAPGSTGTCVRGISRTRRGRLSCRRRPRPRLHPYPPKRLRPRLRRLFWTLRPHRRRQPRPQQSLPAAGLQTVTVAA